MKKIKFKSFIILVGLIGTLISCNKDKDEEKQERTVRCTQQPDYAYLEDRNCDSIFCTCDICNEYLAVWKELFLEKNNLSESYFNEHIILCYSDTCSWNEGISFEIYYRVYIGWAIACNIDKFIIKIKKGNTDYPAIDLPRDIYLSKDNIRIAIENRVFSSSLISLSSDILQYNTMNDALQALIKAANLNTLCSSEIFIDESTGHISLKANGQYTHEENSCVWGVIDLINGETDVWDNPCMIE